MKKMKLPILVLILVLGMTLESCVTKKACERKFPPVIHTETIIRDTVIHTERTSFDTIFHVTNEISRDTVFFTDKETQIRIKYLVKNDSVFVSAECPPDTIRIPVEITKTEVVHEKADADPYKLYIFIGLGILSLFAIGFLIKQFRRIG